MSTEPSAKLLAEAGLLAERALGTTQTIADPLGWWLLTEAIAALRTKKQ